MGAECVICVSGLMALCENMPGQRATKPGDVVTAMNGKTIQVVTLIMCFFFQDKVARICNDHYVFDKI